MRSSGKHDPRDTSAAPETVSDEHSELSDEQGSNADSVGGRAYRGVASEEYVLLAAQSATLPARSYGNDLPQVPTGVSCTYTGC